MHTRSPHGTICHTVKYCIKTLRQVCFLSILTCTLSSCIQSKTHGLDAYHALDYNDIGYSEEEIGPERFEIHYSGTWKQSYAMLGRYSLVRSAELAREMGFSFFSRKNYGNEVTPA